VLKKRHAGGRGILSAYMRSDGTLADLLQRPRGGATDPMTPEILADARALREDGRPRGLQARRALDGRRRDRALDGAKLTGTTSTC
jgi:3-oxoacyl-[acyl-carrier-protein] synthase III